MGNNSWNERQYTAEVWSKEVAFYQDYTKGVAATSDLQQLTVLMNTRSARFVRWLHLRWTELCWTLQRWFRFKPVLTHASFAGPQAQAELAWDGGPVPPPRTPRVLVDVTCTSRHVGPLTGIQRVAWNILRAAYASGEGVPIIMEGDGTRRMFSTDGLPGIALHADDIVIVPDYPSTADVLEMHRRAQAAGAKLVMVVHDLIPFKYPSLVAPGVPAAFTAWLDAVVDRSDAVIAVSKSVALDVQEYARGRRRINPTPLRIGFSHLGADFHASANVRPSQWRDVPMFLSVGTIEPRKGWSIALSAMEKLWRDGIDAHFVLVGRYGWSMRWFQQRVEGHPEFGRRLHWLNNADDEMLASVYTDARALVLPSLAEGFGLPLIEAREYGTPVIASDIPVFREIAGDEIIYFEMLNVDDLASKLKEALANPPHAPAFPVRTWNEAMANMLQLARDLAEDRSNTGRIC